ncbi:MAG: hypothetical protein JRI85_17750 [Deltaproteobacteria bacterium]|nr:hypothetical protein [Deltaproteobacteria bacterium]
MKPPKKEVKKPYVFEYKGAPSFTVQIPGEFVKQKPKQLFLARAQNSIFSISRAKLEEKAGLNQAAEGYAEVLKKLGSGVALKKMSIIKLPDQTPAAEFVIEWTTKGGTSLTTQGLAVYKNGYSISMGLHTWAGKLPDRKILHSIKFK